jgi:hypothetical protein
MPLDDCKLLFTNEIFDVEMPGTQLNEKDLIFLIQLGTRHFYIKDLIGK